MTDIPTLGILGGGQLGRMLAMAAAKIGVRPLIYAPDEHPCAADIAHFVRGAYDDTQALKKWSASCDAITYEFENVDVACLDTLGTRLAPSRTVLEVSQHRLKEKLKLQALDIPVAAFQAVQCRDDIERAMHILGTPLIVKTARFGYDGKGQYIVRSPEDIDDAFAAVGQDAVAEQFVPFVREFSLIAACSHDGQIVTYDPCENIHRDQMLRTTRVPATLSETAHERAQSYIARVAHAFGYVGVLCIEFFLLENGDVVANEIAPRVHNSGHWTIEGAKTSQFENHVRAVMHRPLGSTMRYGAIEMNNIVGHDIVSWRNHPKDGWSFHDYGKHPPKEGRKMGHATRILAS